MPKPNVILILADDMGYGDFSAFNPAIDSTPAIDDLVANGTTLSSCYASSPVCAPARASIMTGRYPQRCGVIDTLETRGYDRLRIDETTMADIFSKNGYTTGLIGKWHLGAIAPEYHPNARGFDYFMGFRGGWNDYYDYHIERNGERLQCDGKYLTDVFSDEAVHFVRKNKDRPFFLHLAYNAPHFPIQAPADIVEKYRRAGAETDAVCRLRAMIEIMDEGIGRILRELDDCRLTDDTIVIFSIDNGPDFGGTGDECLKRYNCILRGEKMLAYEGGIKVPAVMRWPHHVDSGKVSNELVHGTDWLPTLISFCGLPLERELEFDGIDATAAFTGGQLAERRLYWQWNRHQPNLGSNAAARDGNWKLVHAPIREYLDLPAHEIDMDVEIKYKPELYAKLVEEPIDPRPEIVVPIVELYDLSKDGEEKANIACVETARVQAMESQLRKWFAEVERDRIRPLNTR